MHNINQEKAPDFIVDAALQSKYFLGHLLPGNVVNLLRAHKPTTLVASVLYIHPIMWKIIPGRYIRLLSKIVPFEILPPFPDSSFDALAESAIAAYTIALPLMAFYNMTEKAEINSKYEKLSSEKRESLASNAKKYLNTVRDNISANLL